MQANVVASRQSLPDETFVRRSTGANGEQTLFLSQTPLNYRSDNGDWRPIETEFAPVAGGYANDTNVLRIRARADQVVVAGEVANEQLVWQPDTLAAWGAGDVGGQGATQTVLAQSTAGTRSLVQDNVIRYAGGWSLPQMSDEIVAGAGQLEHNVLFAAAPITNTNATTVTLSARLRMPTGLRLYVDGQAQSEAFTTEGVVALGDRAGNMRLTLSPARVFEKRNPEHSIVAVYQFVPDGAGSWRVSMSTPASWWLDSKRSYPVLWDPAFTVVGNLQLKEVRDPAFSNSGLLCHVYDAAKAFGVGTNGTCGERRLVVKFTGLAASQFPPNFTITRAQLVMAPSGGFAHPLPNGAPAPVDTWVDVYAATNDVTNWPGPAKGAQLCNSEHLVLDNGFGAALAQTCDIQEGNSGVVSDWINGGANHGLLLQQIPNAQCGWLGCGFVTFPLRNRWRINPTNATDKPDMDGSGIGLVIHYYGPQLSPGMPFRYSQSPSQSGTPFDRTDHGYQLPSTGSEWTAVGVKALRDIVYLNANTDLQGTFGYVQWSQLVGDPPASNQPPERDPRAYAFPVSVVKPDCAGNTCQIASNGSGDTDSTNFVLVKGSTALREARVGAVAPHTALDGYAIEVAPSQSIPTVPADYATAAYATGVTFEHNFSITTDHMLSVFNLPLLKDTQARVSLSWDIPGVTSPTASVQGWLYAPVNEGDGYAKARIAKNAAGDSVYKVTKEQPTELSVPQSGDWALVMELPGDQTPVDADLFAEEPALNNPGTPQVRTVDVTLKVTVCPLKMEITNRGCTKGNTPDFSQGLNWIAVGDYRVYSPAGFVCNPDKFPVGQVYPSCNPVQVPLASDCPDEWCAVRTGTDGQDYFVTITWHDVFQRVLVVAGSEYDIADKYLLSANTTNNELKSYGKAVLRAGGASPGDPLPAAPRQLLWTRNAMDKVNELLLANCGNGSCPALPLRQDDISGSIAVSLDLQQSVDNAQRQHATFSAYLDRPIQTASGTEIQGFQVEWDLAAEGYRGRLQSPAGDAPYAVSVARVDTPVSAARIASMKYYFGNAWGIHFHPDPMGGTFDSFRNDDGYLKQDAQLGGAMGAAVYIILPFGEGATSSQALQVCQGYCGDIRALNDTWEKPNREWKMPDVNINQTPPAAAGVMAQQADAEVGFSFKTFGARVSIEETECPGTTNGPKVQVIHGETSLSMPGLGSAGGGVEADFYLCESSLRSVRMAYRPPFPGIPVAYPPVMYIILFQGTVNILPDNAIIQLDIGFYVGVGAPRLIDGTGSVIIDTRGRFDVVLNGRVMGIGDTHGDLWVAWQKLDVGARLDNAVPSQAEWVLRGTMGAHVWLGQGWQHMYNWLPDDDQLHVTGDFATMARLPVKSGVLINEFPLVIPPFTITLTDNMQLAAGDFCADDNCSQGKLGMKAKRQIMGYDAGIYVDIANCPDAIVGLGVFAPPVLLPCIKFILGSDSHVLLDQYGGAQEAGLLATGGAGSGTFRVGNVTAATSLNRETVADANAATVEKGLPEVVSGRTSAFLVALAWARGAPTLTLIRPDGQVITAANAADFGLTVTSADNEIILATSSPMAGVWKARIDNATAQDDYHLAYFANKATPSLQFTQPSAPVARSADNPTLRVEWTPPPHADQLRLSLFYTGLNQDLPNTSQQDGGVIGQNIDPSVGFYDWDLRPLPAGQYQISARLEDKSGAAVSALGEDQFVGITTSTATGTLSYEDKQAPPGLDPAKVTWTPVDGGVLMCWPVPQTMDLAEYRLDYLVRDPIGGRTLAERLPADVRYEMDGSARQCTRLVGLINGKSRIEFSSDPALGIRVRDASGNYSGPAKPADFTVPLAGTTAPPTAFEISGVVDGGNPKLSWATNTGQRWELFYAKEQPATPQGSVAMPQSGAGQGPSPIALGSGQFNGSTTVTGLPHGYWYAFAARAFAEADAGAQPGPLSNQVWLLVSDGVDADNDGCADDWQAAHGLTGTESDLDGDALVTRDECNLGTRPDEVDTDGDGWWDGEEVAYHTDPLDPLSYPLVSDDGSVAPLPRLALATRALSFHAYEHGENPAAQTVAAQNLGGGALLPAVQSNQPWLHAVLDNQTVVTSVDSKSLAPGGYEGRVTVSGGSGVLQSPQQILVALTIVAGQAGGTNSSSVYLPMVAGQ